jgi:hypothetical protein
MKRLIGVDLDGTLAIQEDPYNPKTIGPPVARMLLKVRRELKKGNHVWIFTSRVSTWMHKPQEIRATTKLIDKWCKRWLGQELIVTAEKHPEMEIWDNRARQVRLNKGTFVTEEIIAAARTSRVLALKRDRDVLGRG